MEINKEAVSDTGTIICDSNVVVQFGGMVLDFSKKMVSKVSRFYFYIFLPAVVPCIISSPHAISLSVATCVTNKEPLHEDQVFEHSEDLQLLSISAHHQSIITNARLHSSSS